MVVIPLIRSVETIKEAEHVMVEMFLAAKRLWQFNSSNPKTLS